MRAGGALLRPGRVCGDSLCVQMLLLRVQIHWKALRCWRLSHSAADTAFMQIEHDIRMKKQNSTLQIA